MSETDQQVEYMLRAVVSYPETNTTGVIVIPIERDEDVEEAIIDRGDAVDEWELVSYTMTPAGASRG